jgi:uncharacterized protein (TIGR03790 family)
MSPGIMRTGDSRPQHDKAPLLPPFKLWLLPFLFAILCAVPASAAMQLLLPRTAISADELGLIINDDDPLSRQSGEYYRQVRRIPAANVIHLSFPPGRSALAKDEFAQLKAQIDRATPAHVQAYAVAWTAPYRVGCMSLTSALAFGFNDDFCSAKCGPTAPSPYFNSPSQYPLSDHHMRPAMMLAGTSFEQVRALIDRGVAADRQFPDGRAYLLSTPDQARSVRAPYFELTARELAGVFPIEILETGAIENRHDVLFYFTGLPQVPQLKTLGFQPGALADHLTSFGGQLTDSNQMSSLRWLEAGATASYGTVVEPCNHPQKFPFPAVALFHYASGASAIEAYWKSVMWPGEGVFIGEPLARPFSPKLVESRPGDYQLTLFSPFPGQVRVDRAVSAVGPFAPTAMAQPIKRGRNVLRFAFPPDTSGIFRLRIVREAPPAKR